MNVDITLYQEGAIYNQYGQHRAFDKKAFSKSDGEAPSDDISAHDQRDSVRISKEGLEASQRASDRSQAERARQQKIQQEVQRLRAIEEKVKAHEQAHKSAGGQFTGAVSYTYTTGPDGKRYITGGEVAIQIVKGKTPDETIRNMEIVRRAALAPADPSPQDRAVAAQASQIQQRARAEKAKQDNNKESGPTNNPLTANNESEKDRTVDIVVKDRKNDASNETNPVNQSDSWVTKNRRHNHPAIRAYNQISSISQKDMISIFA